MFVMMATSGAASCAKAAIFARMIHPDFPDSDFILRCRRQHRLRKTDVIVESSLLFS